MSMHHEYLLTNQQENHDPEDSWRTWEVEIEFTLKRKFKIRAYDEDQAAEKAEDLLRKEFADAESLLFDAEVAV